MIIKNDKFLIMMEYFQQEPFMEYKYFFVIQKIDSNLSIKISIKFNEIIFQKYHHLKYFVIQIFFCDI